MKPHPGLRWYLGLGLAAGILTAPGSEPAGTGKTPDSAESNSKSPLMDPPKPSLGFRMLEAILPTSMQKRPTIWFNVITEMTEEGRKRREPSPENPVYFHMHGAKFIQTGVAVSAGERPPPAAELETAVRNALAARGYLPVAKPDLRPEILIILTFGSHGTDPQFVTGDFDGAPLLSASEIVPLVIRNVELFKDVIARATLIAGSKFAGELKAALDEEVRNANQNKMGHFAPVSPDFGSPFQIFASTGKNRAYVEHLAEVAFHTCYFTIASAYDYESAEKGEKRLLWRTKMTVDAGGVSLEEILNPLIVNSGPYLGKETEAVVLKKQISRDGKVQVGTPTVIQGDVRDTPPSQPNSR